MVGGSTERRKSEGNRRPDDWLGTHFRVPGLGRRVSGPGVQVQVQVQGLMLHRGRAGFPNPPNADGSESRPYQCRPYLSLTATTYLNAARSARSADPTSRQRLEITKNDEPRTKNSPAQPLCRDAVPTLPNSVVGGGEHSRAKGNRRPEEWLGEFLSGLRSRPSGL